MGCDIRSFTEVRKKKKWIKVDQTFLDKRRYPIFAFLADVRNSGKCEPISEPKGLPKDSEWLKEPYEIMTRYEDIKDDPDYHSYSYLTLKELLDFNYEKSFEKLEMSFLYKEDNVVIAGSIFTETAKEGEGEITSYRNYLGEWFFEELDKMKKLGDPENVRIVFWFDN